MGTLGLGSKEAFYFIEGRTPMTSARKRNFQGIQFAIHPIFSENLQLTHRDNDFILRFDWNYLYDNHTLLTAALV